jgi:hypothetical protein
MKCVLKCEAVGIKRGCDARWAIFSRQPWEGLHDWPAPPLPTLQQIQIMTAMYLCSNAADTSSSFVSSNKIELKHVT